MKYQLTRVLPILLAAALQVLPLLRNLFVNPATSSTMAFILRWGVGLGATAGAVDAVSGASGTVMNTSSNITGTVGIAMTNNVNFVINGGNTADPASDYIIINSKMNNTGISSSPLFNGASTNLGLPPGLTITCVVVSGATSIYGRISGTPTTAITTNISVTAGYTGGYTFTTNLHIVVSAAVAAAPPTITNQPVGLTSLVGNNPTFTVTAGAAPLAYQWRFNANTILANATSASLTLTNVQLANAGYYDVVITNSGGAITSSPALLTVWQPPAVTNQPVALTNVAGGAASFSVTAGGFPAVSYQWNFNTNTPQTGATGSTYTIPHVRLSQAGTYSVVVTNAAGAITSAVARLTVTTPAPPPITSSAYSAAPSGTFQFTFNPVPGLTNTVQVSSDLSSGNWVTLTNLPPPAVTNAISIFDPVASNRFYRIQIIP